MKRTLEEKITIKKGIIIQISPKPQVSNTKYCKPVEDVIGILKYNLTGLTSIT